MTYHYAQSKPEPRQKRQGWGFVILSFSAAFLYIYHFHGYFSTYYHHTFTNSNNSTKALLAPKTPASDSKKSSPEFDFYSMLPKIEVQIKNTGAPNAPQLTSGQTYYLLQIATTPNNTEAQNLITKLGVMGLNAYAKPYQRPNGKTEYRVVVGPYVNKQDVDTDRAYLKTNDIPSLFLSAKAP